MLRTLALLALAAVAGCTSNDVLDAPLASPAGEAQLTGRTPVIGNVPATAAPQLTAGEKSAVRSDLARASAESKAQQRVTKAQFNAAEIAKIRKEAAENQAGVLKRIEDANEAAQAARAAEQPVEKPPIE